MATEANKFKLGLFVVIGLTIAVVGVVGLGAHRYFERTERFVTYFDESIQGLEEGSPVKFRGVPVGRVARVYASAYRKLVAVEMEINPSAFLDESGKPIKGLGHDRVIRRMIDNGLRAQLTFAGITGLKYLELDFGDQPAKPEDLGFTPPSNWLPSAPSTLKSLENDITSAVRELAKMDYAGISKDTKNALAKINAFLDAIDFEATGERLKQVFDDAKKVINKIKAISGNVNDELEAGDFRKVLQAWREMSQNASEVVKQIKEGTYPVLARILDASKSVDDAGAKVKAVAEEIKAELDEADIAKAAASARHAFDKGSEAAESISELRAESRRLIRELNATLRSLRRLIDYLERHPDALISGKREPEP